MTGARPSAIHAVLMLGLLLASCLPKDTRPVPGSLFVTVTADELLLGGRSTTTTTADGWTVSFEKFLITLGEASLEGDSCASYYDGEYRRIFDMQVPGPQKVSMLYALGHCDFGFRLTMPDSATILGEAVTEADRAMMSTRATDLHATDRGIAVYAKGSATKDAVTKTFTWAFRQGIRFEQCTTGAGGDGFDLQSGEARSTTLTVHGETLFMDSTEPKEAVLRFDIIAAADDRYGDADGEVTEGELGKVPLADIGLDNRYTESNYPDGGASTLDAYVYTGLFPKVVRFENEGKCTPTVRSGR